MQEQTYALVVYLRGPLARLINRLRCELNPHHADKLAHVSVLPPRPLTISEEAAVEETQARCDGWEPFEIEMSAVSTFLPLNPVVYLELGSGAKEMHDLHEALNRGHLSGPECYAYVPHVTVGQDLTPEEAMAVLEHVRRELAAYDGPRRFLVERLTFVRMLPDETWVDLADLQLGRAHVLAQ